MSKKLLVLFVLFFFLHPVMAWNRNIHLIIAQIAQNNLNAQAKQESSRLLQVMKPFYPRQTNLISAANWADELRATDVSIFSNWHYKDTPWVQGSVKMAICSDKANAVTALNQSLRVLQSPSSNDFEKSLFLRFLIHITADLHQPLHAISLYSPQFPAGDKGGNLYKIKVGQETDLHEYWDSCLGLWAHKRLNAQQIQNIAQSLQNQYPQSYFGNKITQTNFNLWAKESYNLARQDVYTTPQNETPSKAYIKQGQNICSQQIVLAGYRLANVLNNVF